MLITITDVGVRVLHTNFENPARSLQGEAIDGEWCGENASGTGVLWVTYREGDSEYVAE